MEAHSPRMDRRTLLKGALAGIGAPALAPALAACGGSTSAVPKLSTKPVTITWSTWGDNTNPMVQASAEGAKAFQQKYPNITVQPQAQVGDYATKVLTQMASGSGAPDLIGGCCTTLPSWARKGVLVKLDPFIARDLKKAQIDDFEQNQYHSFSRPGVGQYALPMYMGTYGFLYNKDRFQAAGVALPTADWDWNSWVEAMTKLTDASKQQWGGNVQYEDWQIIANQNGGHVVDPTNPLRCVADSSETLAGLQWIHDQMWKSNVAMRADQAQKGQSSYEALLSGRYATTYFGSWGLKEGGKNGGADAPLLIHSGWDAAVVPKGPKARASLATTDGWVIWTGSPHIAEAWQLMQWLETDDWWNINLPITAQQPSRKSLQTKWVDGLKKNNPGFQDKNLEAFTPPMQQDYAQVEELFTYDDEARKVLNDAYTKAVTDNKAGVSETFQAAAAQVNQIEAQLQQGGTVTTSSSKQAIVPPCDCAGL
jgi:multiple sugar transport system substrate-binding protein